MNHRLVLDAVLAAGAAVSLAVVGCGILIEDPHNHGPAFVSKCGARVYQANDGYQEAEDRAVAGLSPVFGKDLCKTLKNTHVIIRHEPTGWWIDEWDRKVGGLSGCDTAPKQNGWLMVLDDWHELSYFHEMAHRAECPHENVDHVGWIENGVYSAIAKTAALGKPATQSAP